MNDKEERCYSDGSRAAWTSMLGECLRHLGHGPERTRAALVSELEQTRAALLRVLGELEPDYDVPDKLHLADLVRRIEKHLEL